MRKAWLAILLIVGGCVTPTPPVIPSRYQLGTPQATAADGDPVYLWPGWGAENSYTIDFVASRNVDPVVTNTPDGEAIYADLITNSWPYYRNHIDLSIDGGQTWSRRIAYGIPRDKDKTGGHWLWSPPLDYSLLTTNARLRITNLDGTPYEGRTPSRPYDVPAGTYITSFTFPIYGANITAPTAGSIQWRGEGTDITWRQLGGGPVMDLYWLTPTSIGVDVEHWITTISNCVEGVNTKRVSLNAPVADQLKLVLISASDPKVHGYSGAFTVDP